MSIKCTFIKLKHKHQVSQPGQPHISQAVGGEVVEVGQGGHVQEDHQGQVIFMVMGAHGHTSARVGGEVVEEMNNASIRMIPWI